MRPAFSVVACIMLVSPAPGLTQDRPEADSSTPLNLSGNRFTIGVGAAMLPSYIGANEHVIVPAIAVQGQVDGYSFNTQGTSLTVDAVPAAKGPGWKLQAGPTISLRLDRNGLVRDPAVKALGKIDSAWEVGAWLGIQRTGVITSPYDTLSLSVTWQHDVNGVHDSFVVSPNLDYATPLSTKAYVDLSIGADYLGHRFGATYYDISPAGSAASGLSPYVGADRAGWKDWSANLLLARSLTGNLTHGLALFGTVNYSRLLGAYARSPIVADVGNPNQLSGGLGLALTF